MSELGCKGIWSPVTQTLIQRIARAMAGRVSVIGPDLSPPPKNTRYHSNFLIQFSPHKNATSRNESDADRALEDRTLGSITAEEDAVLTLTLSHIVIRVY